MGKAYFTSLLFIVLLGSETAHGERLSVVEHAETDNITYIKEDGVRRIFFLTKQKLANIKIVEMHRFFFINIYYINSADSLFGPGGGKQTVQIILYQLQISFFFWQLKY